MDTNTLLFHLAVVIIAARVAAELSEKFQMPAVVLEILAGFAIGPSVLHLVGESEVLEFFGEVGAILLLLEVGMQMNLSELAKVGTSALRVAVIGMLAPIALGFVLLAALGVDHLVALFLAAGITATSVGITARVFGDLKMLASPEARTVLGAAVADDVGGLMILTVVVGIASTGSIALGSLTTTVGTGLAFVFVAALICVVVAPRILRVASQRSRTEGTLMAVGLAIGLIVARIAAAARLAPIVGSFIAGLGISESDMADDLKRRLAPVGHLFIPIFFLQIGINTDLASLRKPEVLGMAGALAAVAVVSKLVAGLGVGKGAGDRMLVGISMVPRGEVGLIFASLGLGRGVLDAGSYAVLVMVVLFTTLVPPPWIRHHVNKVRRRAMATKLVVTEPPGGWLVVTREQVELAAEPSDVVAPLIGLDAAILCTSRQPGQRLVEWLGSVSIDRVSWDGALRRRLYHLLERGNARSWRFIEVTGLGSALLPTIVDAMHRRRRDPFNLDPAGYLRWGVLEDLNSQAVKGDARSVRAWTRLERKDLVRLAAVIREAFEGEKLVESMTREFARSIGLSSEKEDFLSFVVTERHLLPAASRRFLSPTESVLEIAVQVGSKERAGALYMLAVAEGGMEIWERERLDEMVQLVEEAFEHPDLTGPDSTALIAQRRRGVVEALTHLRPQDVLKHLDEAPRRYLLKNNPESIARHMKMTQTLPNRFEVRLEAEPTGEDSWLLHVAALDRPGLLALIAKALLEHHVGVREAFVSTWSTGLAIDVFRVFAPREVDWEQVRTGVAAMLAHGSGNGQMVEPVEAALRIDNESSPWHTILEVEAPDREGLLYRIASALTRAGIEVHSASLSTVGDVAVDTFHLTINGGDGGKLDERTQALLRSSFAGKSVSRWQRMIDGPKAKARP